MPLVGIRANNDEVALCHWCGKEVEAREVTVEVGILGLYGHRKCYYRERRRRR